MTGVAGLAGTVGLAAIVAMAGAAAGWGFQKTGTPAVVAISATADAAPEVTSPAASPEPIVQTRIAAALFAQLSPEHQRMILNAPKARPLAPAMLSACFAPGTSDAVMQAFNQGVPNGFGVRHNAVERWQFTANQPGGTGDVGNPVVLTWSFVPDGVILPNAVGEGDLPSELFAWMNSLYGSQAQWQPVFQAIYDRWEAISGIDFVYEPNDDGASYPDSPGVLGVRGDMRIGAKNIDGNSGILAYNYYPDTGDMVVNSFDSFYNDLSNNSLRMRNVLAHEVGHGLGFAHVCPVQTNKLMEPFVTVAFDGPRHDDLRAAHRNYGDIFENNDTQATATPLGTIAVGAPVVLGDVPAPAVTTGSLLSIDNDQDVDFYGFSVSQSSVLNVTLTPRGFLYDDATQSCQGLSGSCCFNQFDDSSIASSYAIEVRTAGGTLLTSRTVTGPGPHAIPALLPGAGGYAVSIAAAGLTNPPVLYALSLQASSQALILEYAGDAPTSLTPGLPTQIRARVSSGTQTLNTSSVRLRYSIDGGPQQQVVMAATGQPNEFGASLPAIACGSSVVYSVSASGTSGAPPVLPNVTGRTGVNAVAFADDFESDRGWTTVNAATSGAWQRVDPIGTTAAPEDDASSEGVNAWITQQSGTFGEGPGTNDVDTGSVTLTSPTIDVASLASVRVSYKRWYSNTNGSLGGNDPFRVEASNNNGTTWVPAETIGPGLTDDINNQSGWRNGSFTLAALGLAPSAQLRVRFIAQDLNAGNVIEAGVDDFVVSGLACVPASCEYDYNQDENVDLTDAQLMAQVAAGVIVAQPGWLDGDLNGDENADLTDAQILAAFVATGTCGV